LFDRHARGELDDDGLQAGLEALMAEVGHGPVMDALVKRMEGTPAGERDTLLTILPRLRSPKVIDHLWQVVKKPRAFSIEAKLTALVVLKEMGEDVDLADPGRYLSPRDIKPSDLESAQDMFRVGLRGLARSIRGSRDPAEVEAYMHRINRMPETAAGGEDILLDMVKSAQAGATDLEADFLHALAHTTPFPKVQQAAERALARLAAAGIKPVTRAILDLGQDRFYAAYMTDPDHPWQQSVTVAWERAGGVVQALCFLLDFGVPWRGAIKDMFPTHGMTPSQFQRDLVQKPAQQMGMRLYRVSLARAQATIAAAVEANRTYKIPLPKEFNEVSHLVERWVLHPPAAVIAADSTRDELGDRPLVPDRSGKPVLAHIHDLEHLDAIMSGEKVGPPADEDEVFDLEEEAEDLEEEELYSFADVLADVEATCEDDLTGLPWLQPEWIREYLTSLSPDPDDLESDDEELDFIIERWMDLKDFLLYLDEHAYEIHALADLRGFHLSEYLVEEAAGSDEDDGRIRAEAISDFFTYLARRGLIPSDVPCLPELAQIVAQPNKLSLLSRPKLLGGEIAVWFPMFGDDERDEPFTYNEWWMALVLERKFKRDWDRCRREARKKPDAAAKLALLDRLESRLAEDPEYLDDLDAERPSTPADYKRAEKWFDKEKVSTAGAW
jgi:hypothetical protein